MSVNHCLIKELSECKTPQSVRRTPPYCRELIIPHQQCIGMLVLTVWMCRWDFNLLETVHSKHSSSLFRYQIAKKSLQTLLNPINYMKKMHVHNVLAWILSDMYAGAPYSVHVLYVC